MRYLIPARTPAHLRALDDFVTALQAQASDPSALLLVYADDLERTAGTGGWEPVADGYRSVLQWAADPAAPVQVVGLDEWLDNHPPHPGDVPPAGSYYELAVDWRAGEDYPGWAADPQWLPYARLLGRVEREIERSGSASAARQSDGRLRALADRLAMVGTHETAWHDPPHDDGPAVLAPWARATASHARLALPLLAAARWAATPGRLPPTGTICDIDADEVEELLLGGDDMWALVSPREGARVCLLIHRLAPPTTAGSARQSPAAAPPGPAGDATGGALIVGNPADHWNLQEQLHRFMDTPPAHPGALADPADPHLVWSAAQPVPLPNAVTVDLVPAEPRPSAGSRRYALINGVPALAACLRGAVGQPLDVESALIPDYLTALLDGRADLHRIGGHGWSGWSLSGRICWVGFDPAQSRPVPPHWSAAGHSRPFALRSSEGHIDILLGCGPADEMSVADWITTARRTLHDDERPDGPSAGS
ncbi:hypothetical protein [Streptomyces sp. NPDC059398]|uniref:hypothetical protein n=1 Tax=Streptomyces sp. NPDC059398 TaxID=3346820 RepID=UPI0036C81E2A